MTSHTKNSTTRDIAIVGMSVRMPGANSTSAFWDNLRTGTESIRRLSEEELLANGERPELMADPNYVPAAAPLDDFAQFDPDFFGFSPKEAAILDPQHRKFLEVAWEAMEDAGHPPETLSAPVGVFAGCGMGSYFYFNICSNPGLVEDVGMFLLRHTGNDKDFLSTRVSHVFNLTGPSINLQTACSTSLVAVHYACKALRDGDCGMALAGGVTIELPQGRGYLYKENEILSPDGHCHAFDHRAQGTVFGSGAGVVALRRLEDALADGDHIWAVIKGSAVNNDGAAKAGYLAPSVDGQAQAISLALKAAGVPAETIDYVECHGTGTYLGDPIEVSALTDAYRKQTGETGFCRLGSVKTNIGHLDAAAGVAGLVKTTLALKHGEIPPSLGYEAPNPAIDFAHSPFLVNNRLTGWTSHKGPRRAGINALGVGGTNAHVILEQAPERVPSDESEFPVHILCLSGRTRAALDANAAALAAHLRAHPEQPLADVAFTLKQGRRGFDKRRVLVAETAQEAAALLEDGDPRRVFTHDRLGDAPETVFMFPGGGAQYAGMARDLYETEPVFADWMDRGLDHLEPQLEYDLRALWLPEDEASREQADRKLTQPSVQLPLIMIVEYALAQLWISWGVRPAALLGHSMGENTAACLAGVMRFEDCIDLVLLRGRLFDTVPAGGMLSVQLPEEDLRALLGEDLDIASVNAPRLCAVSGPQAALDQLSEELSAREIDYQRVPIDIAAHSRMLDPILAEFRAFLSTIPLAAPTLPVMSNRTGQMLSAEQACDPDYWVEQLRNTVRFADCVATLSEGRKRVFLEVGPGKALSSLAQMSDGVAPGQVLSSLRHPEQEIADDSYFLGVIGRLWACGVEADWQQIWGEAKRHRLPLPTYAFQSSRYFIEPGTPPVAQTVQTALTRIEDMTRWGYRPAWRPRPAACEIDVETELDTAEPQNWLLFEDGEGLAARIAVQLQQAGHSVTRVSPGDSYAKLAEDHYLLPPEQGRFGYDSLLVDLAEAGRTPTRIGHFWLVTGEESFRPGSSFYDRILEQGFFSLMYLGQALGAAELETPVHLVVFTSGAAQLRDEGLPYPEKALISGPAGVLPRELPGVTCSTVDLRLPERAEGGLLSRLRRDAPHDPLAALVPDVLEELFAEPGSDPDGETVARRDGKRFVRSWRPVALEAPQTPIWKTGGTYLITGGFGGIGLTLAGALMREHGANVILLSRDALPAPNARDAYLAAHSPADRIAQRLCALQDLEALGKGAVMAIAADVGNITRMRAAVSTAEERFGAITGVIHAAGHIDDGPILTKTEMGVAQVFAPKITGLRVLDQLFPDGMLELMVLFSSSSTATRPAGQIDYIAANEYLNAFAAGRKHGATRVMAVDWGVWAEVGMAAEAMAARENAGKPTKRHPIEQPLLDETGFDTAGNQLFVADYDAQARWVFDQHRLASGAALMPGTGYLELAAEAMAAQGGDYPYEIRDLYFLRPLQVGDDAPRRAVIRLEPEGGALNFTVHSALGHDETQGFALNAQARLLPRPDMVATSLDLAAIKARCPQVETAAPGNRLHSPQEAHLRFGPRWHVLRRMALGDGEGVATLSLPQDAYGDLAQGFRLHPGLLDIATGWAIGLAPGYDGSALWVPVSYRAVRVLAPLPGKIHSWVRLSPGARPAEGFVNFDVTLCDGEGRVCVEVEGFEMKRTSAALDLGQPDRADADAAALGLAARASETPLSPDEQRLRHNITQGIRPEQGPEALTRALGLGLGQVVISSLDLPALIAQADHTAAAAPLDEAQSFDRPDLDTAYVAPETGVEKTLAELFESLLGVARVGAQDSFFDLGGHSLIAVRLFSRISRLYNVEFPLSTLFEAPSVAALADLVQRRTGQTGAGEADPTADAPPADTPEFTHLVPLYKGNSGARAPFFLVAGMFGNVLNLRHLALMLGRDRPVYGLQARGLIGSDAPHRRMEEAAADYIAELRQVQPEGPYLLGGFSGGGITAYEMARQLQAAGEQVAMLVLLDTPLPVRPPLSRHDKALIKLQELRRKGPGYLREWAGNRVRWEREKRRAPAAFDAATAFDNAKIEAAFLEAVNAYELEQWSGPLVLFRPPLDRHWQVSGGRWVSAAKEYVYPDNDWTRWAPRMKVIEVPGDHDSMVLVPNVNVLSERLARVLDRAETGNTADGDAPSDWIEAAE
ncbi:type I polyketide synthase [Antarcticimicrobium sediminis]|uniref:SDR family NAD(P)-dependent oxidoreductase n=1 Tax=Antarcticimicrobium sediminis TaxID=2546227 RepID=A0A4R5ELP2_9RHOB|nr:type I polyketide synthase [Antarcticimicrobium sediminis]TDE35589.1 SDR family NAD(P)-dependent oxidoreductase [Antarcticimicrobium sediminis]